MYHYIYIVHVKLWWRCYRSSEQYTYTYECGQNNLTYIFSNKLSVRVYVKGQQNLYNHEKTDNHQLAHCLNKELFCCGLFKFCLKCTLLPLWKCRYLWYSRYDFYTEDLFVYLFCCSINGIPCIMKHDCKHCEFYRRVCWTRRFMCTVQLLFMIKVLGFIYATRHVFV